MKNLKDLYRTEDLYTGYKELDDAVNAAQEKEVAENNVIMEVLSE